VGHFGRTQTPAVSYVVVVVPSDLNGKLIREGGSSPSPKRHTCQPESGAPTLWPRIRPLSSVRAVCVAVVVVVVIVVVAVVVVVAFSTRTQHQLATQHENGDVPTSPSETVHRGCRSPVCERVSGRDTTTAPV
jgi:hypothetical protein